MQRFLAVMGRSVVIYASLRVFVLIGVNSPDPMRLWVVSLLAVALLCLIVPSHSSFLHARRPGTFACVFVFVLC